MNNDLPIVPVVGMGLTVRMYTDSVAMTIVSVSPSGKSFKATRDITVRLDNNGMSDCQDYSYTPTVDGEGYSFRLGSKTGRYKCGIGYALLGFKRAYHDYSF